jgi:hypothetical protein
MRRFEASPRPEKTVLRKTLLGSVLLGELSAGAPVGVFPLERRALGEERGRDESWHCSGGAYHSASGAPLRGLKAPGTPPGRLE